MTAIPVEPLWDASPATNPSGGRGRALRAVPSLRGDELHPGDLIAGKYRVRSILGRRQGLLVDAFHTEFDQRVVIKVLPAGSGDEKAIERFRRESRILAKLESEHVARVIDVGSQDGSFYLVRQFLEGTDLATHIRQRGALPLEEAVLYVLQIAEAIAETHSHGILLRELQPSHLFVTQRSGGATLLKIADFGTAKIMRDAAAPTAEGSLTATAMFGISPYASPELVRKAKDVDARTDVWSLGALLYELLTGRAPFFGDTAFLMLQIAKEEPIAVCDLRQDLPREIEDIVGWALAKDLDLRFKNVHAFAHALLPFASAEGRVLVERIAQIAQSDKQRKRIVPLPPPSVPPMRAAQPLPSVRLPPPSNPPRSFLAVPAPPASDPWRPLYAADAPAFDRDGPTAVFAVPQTFSTSSTLAPSVAAIPSPAGDTSRHRALRIDRRIAFAAVAAAMLILPLLLIVLLVPGRHASAETTANAAPIVVTTPVVAPPSPAAVAPPVVTTAPIAAEARAAATEAAGTSISIASLPSIEEAPGEKPSRTSHAAPRARAPKVATPAPAPSPPPDTTAPSESGTLLAVAIGGTCSFSVNGASKGTTSTVKVSLKPGTYSVTCKPSSGASKSKSVSITSGATAMAMFRL